MNIKRNPALSFSDRQFFWILFLIPFLLYAQTFGFGYVLDDFAVISQNKLVQQGVSAWPDLFTAYYWKGYTPLNEGLYRPLSMLMFAGEWQISPNNPVLPHLVNVVLYSFCCAWLFLILKRLFPVLTSWQTAVITLLFACHPIHVEVVANIKSRDELLGFCFLLCSLHFLLRNSLSPLKDRFWLAGFVLLALFSKESTILFIPVFLFVLYLLKKQRFLDGFVRLLPALLVTLVWLVWRYYVIHYLNPEVSALSYRENSILACPDMTSRVASGIYITGLYLLKCFWPFNQAYDYSFNQIPCQQLSSLPVILTIAVYIGLLVVAYIKRKSAPIVSFGIGFFCITIVLPSNIIFPIGTTMGDRLLFTPVLGIVLALVGLIAQMRLPSKLIAGAFLLVLVFQVSASFLRSRDWSTMDKLLSADVHTSSQSAKVNYNYAVLYLKDPTRNGLAANAGLDTAIFYFKRAIEIDSLETGAYKNLAQAQFQNQDYVGCIDTYNRLRLVEPNNKMIFNQLGDAYYRSNQFDSAVFYNQLTIENKVANAETYNLLANSFFQLNKVDESIAAFEKGLVAYPDSEDMRLNYGNVLFADKQHAKAISVFESILKKNPKSKDALDFIIGTCFEIGDSARAKQYYQQYFKFQ